MRLEKLGKLPEHITKVSMPRYWKRSGKRELRIIIRNAIELMINISIFQGGLSLDIKVD